MENVVDGAPQWRYWDPNLPLQDRWVGLNISNELEGNQWHQLALEGELTGFSTWVVHYRSFSHGLFFTPSQGGNLG